MVGRLRSEGSRLGEAARASPRPSGGPESPIRTSGWGLGASMYIAVPIPARHQRPERSAARRRRCPLPRQSRRVGPSGHGMRHCQVARDQSGPTLDGVSPRFDAAQVCPSASERSVTRTHNYMRHGTITRFSTLNYLDGKLIARTEDRHMHSEWLRFLK